MILSNEPGYYKTAAYGIRIENLVLVIAAPEPVGAEKPLNAFETLTLAPIDRRLVEPDMLMTKERCWLDSYHARVHEIIGPLVDPPARKWLEQATQPLGPVVRKQKRRRAPAKKRTRSRKGRRRYCPLYHRKRSVSSTQLKRSRLFDPRTIHCPEFVVAGG
jgi:hypothetical protein